LRRCTPIVTLPIKGEETKTRGKRKLTDSLDKSLTTNALNPNLMQCADLKSIPWPHHRCRAVFFYYCRTCGAKTRLQRIAMIDLRVDPTTRVADIHASRVRRCCVDRGARQTRDFRLLQARECRQVERLKFRGRFGVGMTVAPLVVALKGRANLFGVFQTGHRHFDVMPLAAVTHLGMMLEEHVAGAEFLRQRSCGFCFHRVINL